MMQQAAYELWLVLLRNFHGEVLIVLACPFFFALPSVIYLDDCRDMLVDLAIDLGFIFHL